jgi:uncharacterized protein DUF4193
VPKSVEEQDEEEEELEEADDEEELETPEEVESSLEELLAKKAVKSEEEDESVLDLTPEERVESLNVRAAPIQANEFVCRSCHLVKHNSQLADRRRKLCRDCV